MFLVRLSISKKRLFLTLIFLTPLCDEFFVMAVDYDSVSV